MVRTEFHLSKTLFAFLLADEDDLSAIRNILHSVFHHGGDDILCDRVYASTPHKDSPSVIPDASGCNYGASATYRPRSFDQVLNLLFPIALFYYLGQGGAGVHRSEGR